MKKQVVKKALEIKVDLSNYKNYRLVEWEHNAQCEEIGCKIAAAYLRQSQGEEESLEAQEASVGRWIKKSEEDMGCVIHLAYLITDKTGAWAMDAPPPKRPGYNTINYLRDNGAIQHFMAREASRYHRQYEDLLWEFRVCRMKGVTFTTMMDGINIDVCDNKNIGHLFQVMSKAITNFNESKNISDRFHENTKEMKECGFWLGAMITGYFPKDGKYIESMDQKGRPVKELVAPRFPRTHKTGITVYGKVLEPVDGWAEAINAAADDIISGGSLRSAGRILAEKGFKPYSNGKVDGGMVKSWLANPILVGYLSNDSGKTREEKRQYRTDGFKRLMFVQQDPDGIPVEGVTPVMKMDKWVAVQQALSSRDKMRTPRTPFLLQGVLTCEKCGYKLTRAQGSSGYNYMVCLNTKRSQCTGVSISTVRVEKYLVETVLEKFDAASIEASHLEYEAQMKKMVEEMPAEKTSELEKLNKKYDIIYSMLMEEESPTNRDKFKVSLDEVAKKIDEIKSHKVNLPKAPMVSNVLKTVGMEGYNLKDVWEDLTIEQKNAVLRAATEGVQVKTIGRAKVEEESRRFFFDSSRLIIWWRGYERPVEWDMAHSSLANAS
jgi:DNA invertase Pin-like site-specific DNA recombinase